MTLFCSRTSICDCTLRALARNLKVPRYEMHVTVFSHLNLFRAQSVVTWFPRPKASSYPCACGAFPYLAVQKVFRVALVQDERRHGVIRGRKAEVFFGHRHVLVHLRSNTCGNGLVQSPTILGVNNRCEHKGECATPQVILKALRTKRLQRSQSYPTLRNAPLKPVPQAAVHLRAANGSPIEVRVH